MKCTETILPGVYVVHPDVRPDARGRFTKTVEAEFFRKNGWRTDFNESFYSVSRTNVLRGMHFQVPPADGPKLVCCMDGVVHDALLDLRKNSPTFGQHVLLEMRGEQSPMIYMPAGIAYGFWVSEGPATVLYYQCASYSPECDKGIAWDKAGISWPCKAPIISPRDATFPSLADFESPFP